MRACSGVSTRATPRASGPEPSTIPASSKRGPRPRPWLIASRTAVINSNSLPQSRTVVAPAARYIGPHSTCSKCACMSQSPGRIVLPRASTLVAPFGIFTCLRGPAATICPFSMTTIESGIGSFPVPSISVPPTRAKVSARLPEIPLEISASAAMPSEPAFPTKVPSALSYPSRMASK